MSSSNKYSPEVRERAVRMVLEHQSKYESKWAAIGSIAAKIGCTSEHGAGGMQPLPFGGQVPAAQA